MYYNFTVQLPSVKGKVLTKDKGGTTYVLYQYGTDYKPDKKYAVPKRIVIGKVDPSDRSRMFPNERFQDCFPEVVFPDELPEAYRSCCLRIGSCIVIRHVMNEYKIPGILKKWFPKDSGLVMDLISYLIVDEENAGQYYPDFAFCHPLFSEGMRIYSDSKVSRFFSSVTKEQTTGFLDDWNRRRNHKQRIYISYDSSNKTCRAGDIDLIEYGKAAKGDKGIPVFNLAIAYDETNRVPLFYEEYPGSITDVSQFICMVDKVNEYGYRKVGFILDRGYFSKDNIRYMEEGNHAFVLMVKGRKALVSSLIEENLGTFETDRDCSVRAYGVYGKTVTARLYEDDTSDRYFHICYNPAKQAAEREQLEQTIEKIKIKMDKCIGRVVTISETWKNYFITYHDKKGCLVSYEERKEAVQRELRLCGYFCIVTSEKMTASEALIHYKSRDVSEKLFRADKSFIGSESMRVQSAAALSAKLFVEFVALIVRSGIYNLLKEMMLKLETRPNYMTVPAALRELEKIEMVRRNDGRYILDHAVTRRQKTILSSFGLNETDVKSIAMDISEQLSGGQTNIADHAAEDEDNDDEDLLGCTD